MPGCLPAAGSRHASTSRPVPAASARPRRTRAASVAVTCKAKRGGSGKSNGKGAQVAVSPKGFGEQAPVKQVVLQDGTSFVDDSLPVYRVYYRPNYLPPKFYGAVDLKRSDDGRLGLVLADDVILGDLLAVSTPIAYLEGGFGQPPELEDLQALMLEQAPSPAQRRVMELLQPPVVTPMGGETAPAPPGVKGGIALLDERYWEERPEQLEGAPKFSAKQLLGLLQGAAYSEEFHDPAAMQVRHQRPLGFIGLWPEFAAMSHSCAPCASVVVIKDRLLVHANRDGAKGEEVTFNKIGRYVAAPLAVRNAQVQELLGRPCSCSRCTLEASLPAEVSDAIADAYGKVEGSWAAAYQEGLVAGDADALTALQDEMIGELEAVEEALADPALGLDEQQQTWLRAALYDAYDQVWQLEELLHEEPQTQRLNTCLQLIKVFAKGSESHVALAMRLDERLEAASQALLRKAQRKQRRTATAEKKLLRQVQVLTQEAEAAAMEYFEAVFSRYGLVPEGLLPQLREGQQLFYEGLQELSSIRADQQQQQPGSSSGNDGGGAGASSSGSSSGGGGRSKELSINGVRVTVVDRVGIDDESSTGASSSGGDAGTNGVVEVINAGGVRMQFVNDGAAASGGDAPSSSASGSNEGQLPGRRRPGSQQEGDAEEAGVQQLEALGFDDGDDDVALEDIFGDDFDHDLLLDDDEGDDEGAQGDDDEEEDEELQRLLALGEDEEAAEGSDEVPEASQDDEAALAAAVQATQQQQQ